MGYDMHQSNVLEELLKPLLVEVWPVDEVKRSGHRVLADHVRRESTVGQSERHWLS